MTVGSIPRMFSAQLFDEVRKPSERPAECKRGSPPPGVSTTLLAVCLLGCFLALLLLAHGEALVFTLRS